MRKFIVLSSTICVSFATSIPPWFFEPADLKVEGFLGFANPSITLKDNYSFTIAKCRALVSLIALKNGKILNCPSQFTYLSSDKLKKLDKTLDNIINSRNYKIERAKIYIPFYDYEIYAVYLHKGLKNSYPYYKDALVCSLEKCKPKYLCNPSIEGYASSLGIAFRATSFNKQYSLALKRALNNFLYMYKTQVDDKEVRKIIKNKLSAFKIKLKKTIFTPYKKLNSLTFLVRSMCLDKDGNLFLYLISPSIKVKAFSYEKPCWIENPDCLGKHVFVGFAPPNINGLRGQLEKAIKRALVNLAKYKGIDIKSKVIVKKNKNAFGVYTLYYEDTRTHTSKVVEAYLIGLYRQGDTLYVGLMERGN